MRESKQTESFWCVCPATGAHLGFALLWVASQPLLISSEHASKLMLVGMAAFLVLSFLVFPRSRSSGLSLGAAVLLVSPCAAGMLLLPAVRQHPPGNAAMVALARGGVTSAVSSLSAPFVFVRCVTMESDGVADLGLRAYLSAYLGPWNSRHTQRTGL